MRHTFARLLAPLFLLCPLFAAAQALPKPAEFYFDEDETVARAIVAVEGGGDAAITQLLRLRERGGRNGDKATAQLAHLSMSTGRVDTGKALYESALVQASRGSSLLHALHWNYGWDLYRSGDVEGALAQWTQAFGSRLVRPAWVPPTLALALWQLDRKPEAIAWYAAAVRTQPQRWSNAALLPALLPDWRDAERATLAEVHAAWVQAPPAWP